MVQPLSYIHSHPLLPSFTTFKKLAFCLNVKGGTGERENSHRLQPHSPVDEWLLMCGEHSWLSWPLWGKVKTVVFLRQLQFLKDYLFIMLSIYNSFRKLFQNGQCYINKPWYSMLHRHIDTHVCMCMVFTGMHSDIWREWIHAISVIWSTSYYCTFQTAFWSILIPLYVETLKGLNVGLHKVK